jgi:hypothetical protein
VIQVIAVVLNAKTDTQNVRALLHGARLKTTSEKIERYDILTKYNVMISYRNKTL